MLKTGIKLFTVVFLSQLATVCFAYDFSVENDGTKIYYKIKNAIDTVAVTSKDDAYGSYFGDVNIPDSVVYDGKTYIVGEIGNSAFRNCGSLSSVKIPKGVTSIGDDAFRKCTRITNIKLPTGLKTIGYYAFGMTDLDSISVPSKVEEIGGMAFADCANLKSVKLPDKLKIIDNYAFMNCRNLRTLN
ncbi:MAG: leucine-rich repeat domain-containing protein, partial [Bacteroidales bacterium]